MVNEQWSKDNGDQGMVKRVAGGSRNTAASPLVQTEISCQKYVAPVESEKPKTPVIPRDEQRSHIKLRRIVQSHKFIRLQIYVNIKKMKTTYSKEHINNLILNNLKNE